MAEAVVRKLTGWSLAQLAAWRVSLLPSYAQRAATARAMAVWPESVPVGESLRASFDRLSAVEQRRWGALQADADLSPLQRAQAMRGPSAAERLSLSRLCDAASARAQGVQAVQGAQGQLFTDAALDESIPERLKLPAHARRE